MDRQTFVQRFREAHGAAVSFARRFVVQELPEEKMFLLHLNQSYDGNPLVDDEETYPEDSLPGGKPPEPLLEDQVISRLWRDGKVPEWVNLCVQAQDDTFTYIELLCCGRYTAQDENLYHQHEGYAPFHVLGPDLPIGWRSIEESGRFDLYWRTRKPA